MLDFCYYFYCNFNDIKGKKYFECNFYFNLFLVYLYNLGYIYFIRGIFFLKLFVFVN